MHIQTICLHKQRKRNIHVNLLRLIKLISREKENEVKQFDCGLKETAISYYYMAIVKPCGAHHVITTISVERNDPFI